MLSWPEVRREARAVAAALRFDPDRTEPVDPRTERLAAGAIGLLVLVLALGTYLAAVGGLGPGFGQRAAGAAVPRPPARTSSAPAALAPTGPATPVPHPVAPTTRPRPRTTGATVSSITTTPAPTPSPTPTPTPEPTPTPTPTPSPDP